MPVINSIGTNARDFADVQSWEAWAQGQFGITPDEYIGEIYDDGGYLVGTTLIADWGSTDETNHPTLRAAAGNENKGVIGTGARISSDVSNAITLQTQVQYTLIQDIEVLQERSNRNAITVSTSGNRSTVERCTIWTNQVSNSEPVLLLNQIGTARNNLVISPTDACIRTDGRFTSTIDNNTCIGPISMRWTNNTGPGSSAVCRNNVFDGIDEATGPAGTYSNNGYRSGNEVGTTPITFDDTAFTNYAGGDYTPAAGGAFDGAGLDLSTDFTDDIAGNTRIPPWEIGAYEIAAAAGLDYTLDPAGGGDFTTMSAAESQIATDFGNLGPAPVTLECWTGSIIDSVRWDMPGTSATNDVTIFARAGDEHKGVRFADGGGGFRITSTASFMFRGECYLNVRDIEIEYTGTGGGKAVYSNTSGLKAFTLERCLVSAETMQSGSTSYAVESVNDVDTIVRNSIIVHNQRGMILGTGLTGLIENCSVIGITAAQRGVMLNDKVTVKNTVAVGGSVLDFSGTGNAASTNNASGDTTGDITGVVLTDGVDFVSPSTRDYNAQSGGKLDSAGADLSGSFTDDITGFDRTTTLPFEIGAYEIQVAPGAPVLSAPTQTNIGQTQADIGCTTDTAGGTLYWYVSTSATPPSAADLKAGTGAVSFGNFIPILGANSVTATGLTEDTEYWHHWIQDG